MTSDIDFPVEEPVPPAIIDKPAADFAIADIVTWNLGTDPMLRFEVRVQDPNRDEVLYARWRLSGGNMPSQVLSDCDGMTELDREVINENNAITRDFAFTFDPTTHIILAGCYRLELVVSGSFNATCREAKTTFSGAWNLTTPRTDKAEARWYLVVRQDDLTPPDLSGCGLEEPDQNETATQVP